MGVQVNLDTAGPRWAAGNGQALQVIGHAVDLQSDAAPRAHQQRLAVHCPGHAIHQYRLRGLIFALQVDAGAGAQPFNVWA